MHGDDKNQHISHDFVGVMVRRTRQGHLLPAGGGLSLLADFGGIGRADEGDPLSGSHQPGRAHGLREGGVRGALKGWLSFGNASPEVS